MRSGYSGSSNVSISSLFIISCTYSYNSRHTVQQGSNELRVSRDLVCGGAAMCGEFRRCGEVHRCGDMRQCAEVRRCGGAEARRCGGAEVQTLADLDAK